MRKAAPFHLTQRARPTLQCGEKPSGQPPSLVELPLRFDPGLCGQGGRADPPITASPPRLLQPLGDGQGAQQCLRLRFQLAAAGGEDAARSLACLCWALGLRQHALLSRRAGLSRILGDRLPPSRASCLICYKAHMEIKAPIQSPLALSESRDSSPGL